MRGWLNRKRNRDVETELVQSRPTPPDSLVRAISTRVQESSRPVRVPARRYRLGLATAALVAVAAVLGATGGLSYAASNLAKLAHIAQHSTQASSTRPSHGPTAACSQYGSPPTITSFSPTSGKAGATVTINGTNYKSGNDNWVTSVRFNGVGASFTIVSATQISAHVPANATVGHISVTNCKGTATSAGTFKPLPSITSFTPGSGKAGSTVTINGANFLHASSVKFHGTPTSFTIVSYAKITAAVPAAATRGSISVTTPAGTSTSSGAFSPLPSIKSFTPASAKGGVTVTINGANFTGTTSVKFHGVAASFSVISYARITAHVPKNATKGSISVTTPTGTAVSSGIFNPLPNITSFTPASGKAGATVTINGANFLGATQVRFHGVLASFHIVSYARITAHVPVNATKGTITVTTPAGVAISAGMFSPLPNITSFTPTAGSPGTVVTINGTNFLHTSTVKFNGHVATFTANSYAKITAHVPGGATTGRIAVTTPAGTALSSSNFTVH